MVADRAGAQVAGIDPLPKTSPRRSRSRRAPSCSPRRWASTSSTSSCATSAPSGTTTAVQVSASSATGCCRCSERSRPIGLAGRAPCPCWSSSTRPSALPAGSGSGWPRRARRSTYAGPTPVTRCPPTWPGTPGWSCSGARWAPTTTPTTPGSPTSRRWRGGGRRRRPVLGICLGHQLRAVALGGEVGATPRGQQIGVLDVGWTDAATTTGCSAAVAAPRARRAVEQRHRDPPARRRRRAGPHAARRAAGRPVRADRSGASSGTPRPARRSSAPGPTRPGRRGRARGRRRRLRRRRGRRPRPSCGRPGGCSPTASPGVPRRRRRTRPRR